VTYAAKCRATFILTTVEDGVRQWISIL